MTELALVGWSVALASSAVYAVASAAWRRTPRWPKSRFSSPIFSPVSLPAIFRVGPGAAFVVIIYALLSEQAPLFRALVAFGVALRSGAVMHFARAALPTEIQASGGLVRNIVANAAMIFFITSPELIVLGGSQQARVTWPDYSALALFAAGCAALFLRPRFARDALPAGIGAMLAASYALAWREPTGFLTLFAPLLAWQAIATLIATGSERQLPDGELITKKTQIFQEVSKGCGNQAAPGWAKEV